MKEEKDYEVSKLFPHLEELKLDNEMPFYTEAKKKAAEKEAIAKSAPPVKNPVPAKETPVMAKTANKPITPRLKKILYHNRRSLQPKRKQLMLKKQL